MRPAKHATHAHARAQEIFDISIARLITRTNAIPLVVTSEREKITLFAWNESNGRWHTSDINHVPIETPRGVPSITNTWNWSRRAGLTIFDQTIVVVYKRAERVAAEESPKPPVLMLDTFRLDNGFPRRDLHIRVPMPTFVTSIPIFPPIIQTVPERPGFELWSGVDHERRKLLIVTQTLGEKATDEGDNAELTLLLGDLDRLHNEEAWTFHRLDSGGYGLDVRHHGDKLILVYRTTPHSLKIPVPFSTIDPFFGGGPQIEIGEQANSDQFYSPLRVMTFDLESMTSRTIDLSGGEHPRIQNVSPLFIVVDRPRLRIRFRVARVGQRQEPRIDWTLRGLDKLAFLFDDSERIARGVLVSFQEGDQPAFPRTSALFIDAQDLFTAVSASGVGWGSTKARIPLEPLRLDTDEKGLFFDFLHKAPLFALLESRARFTADFSQGLLTVVDLQSAVFDINHAQFASPDRLRPDATGENAQFAPFERLSQQAGNVLTLPAYVPDNTIGGSVVTDRDGSPFQFFSYVDLGDGGLRVTFDADLGPPDAPPPVENPKVLGPERVPGPGSGDERWIELTGTDWQDAGVPAIRMESLLGTPSTVISAIQSQIESLLVAGFTLAELPPMEPDGWSDDQINSIQTALNDFMVSSGAEAETIFSTDGIEPRAFIGMLPPVVIADADTIWEAGVEGATAVTVEWRFTSPSAIVQPTVLNRTGNRIPVSLFLAGDWTVRANITLADGTVRTFETVATVKKSLFRTTASVHQQIALRDLGDAGFVRIGSAIIRMMQYELHFTVDPDDIATHHVLIKTLDKTDAQWQFLANGTEQGLINYRFRIGFESSDIRLGGLVSWLLKIESIKGSFFYRRSFMPGVLMNDTRSAVPLSGAKSSSDTLEEGGEGSSLPRLASAITARPFGDDSTIADAVEVKVSMLPQALVASVITLLLLLGATAVATTLTALVATAAAASIVGVAGAAIAIAATIAIFVLINFVVPPLVEKAVRDNVQQGMLSEDSRKSLADARLMQFAGEGIAEAIARQVIEKAIAAGAQLDPPVVATVGRDRFRQDLFQMIHVSGNLVRVLIRA